MSKEILEITPSGGIYCLVNLTGGKAIPASRRSFNCARPNGYLVQDLLNQIRLADEPSPNFATDGDILRWALAKLCETPLGRALAHEAQFNDWMIVVEDGDTASGNPCLDEDLKCVFLSRSAESATIFSRSQDARMQFLFHLLKTLRLIWQDNMATRNAEDLSPEDFLKRERLLEADGDLCGILAAYQLRENGDHDFWRYLLSSDLHKIAVTLGECLDYDASQDGILEALCFVFQDWFADDARLSKTDHLSLTRLDSRLDDDFGHENMEFEDLLQISMLPEGYSYLEYTAAEILSDTFFTRIPDETNAAHLRQIKTESQVHMIEEIGFRDPELARKFFPHSTFETIA